MRRGAAEAAAPRPWPSQLARSHLPTSGLSPAARSGLSSCSAHLRAHARLQAGAREQATGTPAPEHPSPWLSARARPPVQTDCRPSTPSAGLEPDAGGSSGLLTAGEKGRAAKAGPGRLAVVTSGAKTRCGQPPSPRKSSQSRYGDSNGGASTREPQRTGVCPSESSTVPTAGSSLPRQGGLLGPRGHTAFSFPDLPDSRSCRPSDDRSY